MAPNIPESEITPNNNINGKRASKGRRRVEIKRVEEKNKRHVTFSKRKKGFFNKAAELSVLTGAEMAGIVVSGNGKVFCFGSPTPDAVIDRYRANNASLLPAGQPNHHDQNGCVATSHGNTMRCSNKQVEDYMEAKRRMESEKIKRGKNNKNSNINNIDGEGEGGCCYGWWEKPIEMTSSLEELEEYMAALNKLKQSVDVRTNQMLMDDRCNFSSLMTMEDNRPLVKGEHRNIVGCNFSSLITMDDRLLVKGEQLLV